MFKFSKRSRQTLVTFENSKGTCEVGVYGSEEFAATCLQLGGTALVSMCEARISESAERVRAGQRVAGRSYAGVVVRAKMLDNPLDGRGNGLAVPPLALVLAAETDAIKACEQRGEAWDYTTVCAQVSETLLPRYAVATPRWIERLLEQHYDRLNGTGAEG